MKLVMRKGRLVDQEADGSLRKWVDWVAILVLSSAGVISGLLISRDILIPDSLILLLFGTGALSSGILLKTNLPFEKEQGEDLQPHRSSSSAGSEGSRESAAKPTTLAI